MFYQPFSESMLHWSKGKSQISLLKLLSLLSVATLKKKTQGWFRFDWLHSQLKGLTTTDSARHIISILIPSTEFITIERLILF